MTEKKRHRKLITRTKAATPKAHFPRGWDRSRAEAVAEYYGNQSDDDAIAEAEAAFRGPFGKPKVTAAPAGFIIRRCRMGQKGTADR